MSDQSLATHRPVTDQDIEATSLAASLRSAFGITVTISSAADPVGGAAYREKRLATVDGLTTATQPAVLARLEAAMAPAPAAQIDQWVAALHAGTKHRNEDSGNLKLIQKLYRTTLQKYPADVARRACWKLLREGEWFPVVKEVADCCDALATEGRAIVHAVRSWREVTPAQADQRSRADQARALLLEAVEAKRRFGVIPGGNLAALSPERRAEWDRIEGLRAEARRIEFGDPAPAKAPVQTPERPPEDKQAMVAELRALAGEQAVAE